MRLKLKKLNEQVMVITGASSGIGLATARMAAQRGAKLVLAARSEDDLLQLVQELRGQGAQAISVVADVGSETDVRRIRDEALRAFGGFDTWVNNAGVSIYGRFLEVSSVDMRRLFETNFWGVVYGSRVACEHLRQRGGALINVGSEVSDQAVPLQSVYSASKHAVKGLTDALRMELEDENAPVSITLSPARLTRLTQSMQRTTSRTSRSTRRRCMHPSRPPRPFFTRRQHRSAISSSVEARSSCRPWANWRHA